MSTQADGIRPWHNKEWLISLQIWISMSYPVVALSFFRDSFTGASSASKASRIPLRTCNGLVSGEERLFSKSHKSPNSQGGEGHGRGGDTHRYERSRSYIYIKSIKNTSDRSNCARACLALIHSLGPWTWMLWRLPRQVPLPHNFNQACRGFARVIPRLVQGELPPESVLQTQARSRKTSKTALDNRLLEFAAELHQEQRKGQCYIEAPDLYHLVAEYDGHSGAVLSHELPYESRPSASRRINFSSEANDVFLVAHVAENGLDSNISVSSAFALNVGLVTGSLIVTCAHTLEEVHL